MKAVALVLSCLLFLNTPYAYSHGGGLNSDGCHNTSSGGYHCHGTTGGDGGSTSVGDSDSLDGLDLRLALAVAGGLFLILMIRYAISEGASEDLRTHQRPEQDQDSFSVSTTPLLIPQGGGLSLELSF